MVSEDSCSPFPVGDGSLLTFPQRVHVETPPLTSASRTPRGTPYTCPLWGQTLSLLSGSSSWKQNCLGWTTHCTEFNSAEFRVQRARVSLGPSEQAIPFPLTNSACPASFHTPASLQDAKGGLAPLTSSSLIIMNQSIFSHLVGVWVSSSRELSLRVLCLPVYCVFSFWFIGISCIF